MLATISFEKKKIDNIRYTDMYVCRIGEKELHVINLGHEERIHILKSFKLAMVNLGQDVSAV